MILWLVIGAVLLFLLLGGMRAFARASVTSIKSLLAWIAALGGISLALLLILTGRGGFAVSALLLFGPLLWQKWQSGAFGGRIRGAPPPPPGGNSGRRGSGPHASGPPNSGPMTRDEAYQVLGVPRNASEQDIRIAHRRLMRAAHPDSGGSDWLAARINQARDLLLGGRGRA